MQNNLNATVLTKYDVAYVINLDRSKDRWNKISNQLDAIGLPYQRFVATDGYKAQLTPTKRRKKLATFTGYDIKTKTVKMNNKLVYKITCDPNNPEETFNLTGGKKDIFSAGEIGALCSHMSIWKEAVRNNYKNTVVFEDDFVIAPENFIEKLNHFIEDLPTTYDLAYIDAGHASGTKIPLSDDLGHISSFSAGSVWYGAWAYVFSNKFATSITKVDPYIRSIDQFLLSQSDSKSAVKYLAPFEVYVASLNLSAIDHTELSGYSSNSITSQMGCRQYHEGVSLDCNINSFVVDPEL